MRVVVRLAALAGCAPHLDRRRPDRVTSITIAASFGYEVAVAARGDAGWTKEKTCDD